MPKKKKVTFTITLSNEDNESLEKLAKAQRRSKAMMIRCMIDDAIKLLPTREEEQVIEDLRFR